jgi:hypothetical protein
LGLNGRFLFWQGARFLLTISTGAVSMAIKLLADQMRAAPPDVQFPASRL